MKNIFLLSAAATGLLFLLGACGGGGEPAPTLVPTPVYPECDPALLSSPSLVSPVDGMVVSDLTPMLEWASPGYVIEDPAEPDDKTLCKTTGFNIHLASAPYFQDELVGVGGGVPGFDSLYTVIWSPMEDLKPATEYHWYVVPVSQDTEGPASDVQQFFTGPACEAGSLVAPIPLSPLNHWTEDDLGELTLTWFYPDECLPDGYTVQLSTSLDLAGSPLNTTFDQPVTHWDIGALVMDCQRYYWRVLAIKDGLEGQTSQLFTFKVDLTGTCSPDSTSMLRGTLWEDQCDAFAGSDPLPLGCVLNAYDMLFTNQTYDPGEPGIEGAVVTLADGACPMGTILRAVPTYYDGTYDFYQLSAGTYCVGVDVGYAWNGFLLPGTWTHPGDAVNEMAASQTVVIGAGETATADFGWWYTYGNGWGETTGSVYGMVWHDMCAYTPGDPEPDPMPVGCSYDEWGVIHADGVRLAHEPGIPGVVVDIGPGDCPSSGFATALTDYNGVYHFNDLPAGDYCLRIDPAHGSSNEAILMPGSWTVIPSGHEGMTFRSITIEAAETLPGQDFGWDYDNLPLASLEAWPTLTLDIPANCRKGPSLEYEVATFGAIGQNFMLLGRNEEATWFFVRFNDSIQCWFAKESGPTTGDLGRLPVYPAPLIRPACTSFSTRESCPVDYCRWAYPPGSKEFDCIAK